MSNEVLIDIDGVLATDNIAVLLDAYNQLLHLEIPSDQLVSLSYEAFHDLVQVRQYREKVGEARYHRQLDLFQWHPEYIAKCNVIQGALAGVQALAPLVSDLRYCTARVMNFDERWNRHLAAATQLWLMREQFPNYCQVDFCDGIPAKLKTIAQRLRENQQKQIWLVDDSAQQLLEAFFDLSEEDQAVLIDRFTLVMYGYKDGQGEHPLKVRFLEQWKNVHQFLEKEFKDVTLRASTSMPT